LAIRGKCSAVDNKVDGGVHQIPVILIAGGAHALRVRTFRGLIRKGDCRREHHSGWGDIVASHVTQLLHGNRVAGPDHRGAGAGTDPGGARDLRARRRTAWHTHPLGQTLHVTRGSGRVQSWGGPVREIRAGDTVWFPPGEKHWHGASPTAAMAHIAIQEALDGAHVAWLEHVTDEQYEGKGG
jgi:mannose-6-phosphate isomerase-like protein (cupin superfamily)